MVFIVEQSVVLVPTEHTAVHACAPSLWSSDEVFVAPER